MFSFSRKSVRETNELQERSDANIKSHTALDEASSDDVSEFSNGARAQGNFHVQRHTSPGVDQETQIDRTESYGDEFVAGYCTDYDLTTSRRGKLKIHHRGHFYINQYYSGSKAYRYWVCVKRYCKGRLNMDKEGRIMVRGEHTHSVNDTGILFTVVDGSDSSNSVEYLTPSNHRKVEQIILKTLVKSE
ncbi:hypothetical protein RUM43_003117 [Polyplax serrata]|uniref:FLYWCH-type domain-containing protein n=1 Tax=Polyplax serrata TaxID=468196 RepID=A0AAN8S303_POLSC